MSAPVSHWLGDIEDLYHESMDVGVTGDRIMLSVAAEDRFLTPPQAAQLALLLIRAYWIAKGSASGGEPLDGNRDEHQGTANNGTQHEGHSGG